MGGARSLREADHGTNGFRGRARRTRFAALVAREHRAILLARELQHFGGAERMVAEDVGAEQPEPSRKPDEIAVGGEFWRLVHFCHRSPM